MLDNGFEFSDDKVIRQNVNSSSPQISGLRSEIDILDGQITELLSRRLLLAAELAAIKSGSGLPVLDKEREESVLEKVEQQAGTSVVSYVLRIYRKILSESRLLQSRKQNRR